MNHPTTNLVWTEPHWLNQMTDWIKQETTRQNIQITGDIEQPHVRLWATVLRVPTDGGLLFAKAGAPLFDHEAAVVSLLAKWRVDDVPPILAIHLKKNWLLMGDGGTRLREYLAETQAISDWERVLTRYAELQINVSGHLAEFLAMKVPYRGLEKLPAFYTHLIHQKEFMLIDQPNGITTAHWEQLVDLQASVEEKCRQLAHLPIPNSIHHGDLHDGNIFANSDTVQFFDWGDSSISHPFFSLRTAFVSMENTLGIPENDPIFDDIAKVYLKPWATIATPADCWQAYQLAKQLWAISSAWIWYNLIANTPDPHRQEYLFALPSLMLELLEANDIKM
jgi:hypothetical protein